MDGLTTVNKYYVYVYLDPRKPGKYKYKEYEFNYEPFYVGRGTGYRYKAHLWGCLNKYFKRKLNKLKELNLHPIIKIVKNFLSHKEASELEKYLIKNIGRKILVNQTDGGDGGLKGYKHFKKTKEKIKLLNKKFYKNNPGIRKGKNNAMFGKKQSDKCKNINRLRRLGSKMTKDIKNKISRKLIGRPCSKLSIEINRKRWLDNPPGIKYKWTIRIPNNETIIIKNFKDFSQKNNLNYSSFKNAICKYGYYLKKSYVLVKKELI